MSYIRMLSYYEPQFPMPQGRAAGPYPRFVGTPGLGLYRPNQAFYRGITNGTSRQLAASIDPTSIDLTDPGTLLMLAGAAAILYAVMKGARKTKRAVSKFRRRRSARRRPRRDEDELKEDFGIRY
jgi:hypothetical protein